MRHSCVAFVVVFSIMMSAWTATASAASRIVSTSKRELPQYFYHWITADGLAQEWRLDALRDTGKLPLPHVKKEFLITRQLPELIGRGGLFVWNHPITGLGSGPTEIYGDVVIMISTQRTRANIMELETEYGSRAIKSPQGLDGVDVIHHKRYEGGRFRRTLVWEEYIILNPDIVDQFTADPVIIRKRLANPLRQLRAGKTFDSSELHFKFAGEGVQDPTKPLFNSPADVKMLVLPLLDHYMTERKPATIPQAWRRPFNFTWCDSLRESFYD